MSADQRNDTLIVMLPGALMTPQHYIDAGFRAALAQSTPTADLHLAAYDTETLSVAAMVNEVLPTLRREVIQPARQRGYRRIVLGGISLGGMLTLQYVRHYPGDVDGLCLLAPYPGSGLITGPIRAAGGLAQWQPDAEQARDGEFQLWHWLAQSPPQLPIYLAYGGDDRFAPGMGMMVAALPTAQTHIVVGGHDWDAWRPLWDEFLATQLKRMTAG